MRRLLGLALAGTLLAAACTDDDDAGPVPTTEPRPSTSLVDRSGIALAGVPGETTTSIRETGTARIVGSVRGPAGPVAGATVRLERLVGSREVRTDVLTGADGRFLVENVPGGRYRVRAFQAPSLVQLTPEVRFLADREEHSFDLVVEQQGGLSVLADAAPAAPLVGDPVNVVAAVLEQAVDADGVLRAVPVVGVEVQLTGLGRWSARGAGGGSTGGGATSTTFRTATTRGPSTLAARTDGEGRVRFELRCDAPGAPGLQLRDPVRSTPAPSPDPAAPPPTPTVTMQPFDLGLPACGEAAPPTTAAPTTTGSTTTSGDEPG